VNIDDGYADVMLKAAGDTLAYSCKDDKADLVAKEVMLHSDRVGFCALTTGRLARVELRIPGMFSVYNALSAIAASLLLGFDLDGIAAALGTCGGVRGRAEVVPVDGDFTVLVDYAHTPDALVNIITAVRGYAKGRVITLFGCGGDRDRTKRPIMGRLATELSDYTIVTSDNPRTEQPDAIIAEILAGIEGSVGEGKPHDVISNRREAIYRAMEIANPGDVVIVAGKGHETYQILGREKTHFDDREVVTEYFARGVRQWG
jgi:UDP-N-acetylmuramoyl-L-alanyl-D-glutamate--2,6-diaminopimelate ligase